MLNSLISAIQLEWNKETVLKTLTNALDILWKGMLAILVVILLVMAATYLMQYISARKQVKAQQESENSDNIDPDNETEL